MPDDTKSQQIEKRIDREVAGAMLPAVTGGAFNLVPKDMGQAMEFGKLMAVSGGCVRPAFRNNPGMCLALALQAWRDGGDPFAYANNAYIVNDQLAYESKLVHAIVNTRAPTAGRLRTTYSGDGPKRRCKVIGYLRGEAEPFEYESPEIGTIKVKNSPLWQSDPDQQLHYFSVRSWARRHVPEVLLGIYTPDEIQGEIIDMTPHQVISQEATQETTATIMWEVADGAGEVYEFEFAEGAIDACRRILIKSAADPATLATAWENNAGFLLSLGQDGLEGDAQALERLHNELLPKPATGIAHDQQDIPKTDYSDEAINEESLRGSQTPTPAQQPERIVTDGRGGPAPAGGHQLGQSLGAVADEPLTPLDPALGNRENAANVSDRPQSDILAERGEGPARTRDGNGPTVTSAASPSEKFWTLPSLRIDPNPVRGGGSLSKLEWKTWPVLIAPRIRQARSIDVLNALYQDNADNLDKYEVACGAQARVEIDAAFDAARAQLS